MESRIKLGVSACLLGENVRYDGTHKHDRWITDVLGRFVDFVGVCPEVECGLPVPRESMHLEGNPAEPHLITTRTRIDHTQRMKTWAARRLEVLAKEDLCGYICKSNSPSSGMERVKVHNEKGAVVGRAAGLFARAFMDRFPLLPVEDEGRLHDSAIRENFIERVFTLKRWRDEVAAHPTRGALVAFHTRHKLLVLSHNQKLYREMGPLVAHAKELAPKELYTQYERLLLQALSTHATVPRQVNVLQHAVGFLRDQLSDDERAELREVIQRYADGYVPLIVPITLINHHVRKHNQPYLRGQVYLNPHPVELQLRNHA